MRAIVGLISACLLSGCGSSNQALFASGGHQDFVAMQSVSEDYGTAEPDATVPVMVAMSSTAIASGFIRRSRNSWPKPHRWRALPLLASCAG
jgi:hypothetical protein